MRYNKLISPIVIALLVLPPAVSSSAPAAAGQPRGQGFKILLSDGSALKGAVSFTLKIDTQYGQLTVPSTDVLSADFDSTGGWAEIRTKSVSLRVHYKPESSVLQAITEVGPVNVDLAKVVRIAALYPELPPTAPPEASTLYEEPVQIPPSLADICSQPATLLNTAPYDYGAPAPYCWPPYCPTQPYRYTAEYPYFWPSDFGGGLIGFTGFGLGYGGRHGRFGGQGNARGSRHVRQGPAAPVFMRLLASCG